MRGWGGRTNHQGLKPMIGLWNAQITRVDVYKLVERLHDILKLTPLNTFTKSKNY